MKKISTFLTMAFMALMSITIVSCDEDDAIAYTLEGTWEGRMYTSSWYDDVEYEVLYSEIDFVRDPYRYSSGRGYWIDYYRRGPWGRDYVANHIEWQVVNGAIQVYFIEDDAFVSIHDYSLDDNYFTGVIYYGDNRTSFRLRHTSSPNWNDYYYGWDYYAKPGTIDTRVGETPAKPVRMFGRTQTED